MIAHVDELTGRRHRGWVTKVPWLPIPLPSAVEPTATWNLLMPMNLIPSAPPPAACSLTATIFVKVALLDSWSALLMLATVSSIVRAFGVPAFCKLMASDCCTPLVSSAVTVMVCLSEPSVAGA